MHTLMRHPIDCRPEIKAFVGRLTPSPAYEQSLAKYWRSVAVFKAIDDELKRVDIAIEDSRRSILEDGKNDLATQEAIARFARLSAEREYLPGLRRQAAIQIGWAISDWGIAVRPLVKAEAHQRAGTFSQLRDELAPTRRLLRQYPESGWGLEGERLDHYESLMREMAALEPLEESHEQAKSIGKMIDEELQERFCLSRRADDRQGINHFLVRAGIDRGQPI